MLLCTVATVVLPVYLRVTHQAPSRNGGCKKTKRHIWAEAKKEFREVWNSLILVWLVLGSLAGSFM